MSNFTAQYLENSHQSIIHFLARPINNDIPSPNQNYMKISSKYQTIYMLIFQKHENIISRKNDDSTQ